LVAGQNIKVHPAVFCS